MKTWKRVAIAVALASFLASPALFAETQGSTAVVKQAKSTAPKAETKAAPKAAKAKKGAKVPEKTAVTEPAPAPTPPPPPMRGVEKWEYQAFKLQPPKRSKWIKRWNDLGEQGWDFVASYENYYIFKRPLGK